MGEGKVDWGVETGVSGGVGAPEEGDDLDDPAMGSGYDCDTSISNSISSGSNGIG